MYEYRVYVYIDSVTQLHLFTNFLLFCVRHFDSVFFYLSLVNALNTVLLLVWLFG